MYEFWAPENEGRVLLQHKVCISVACAMCYPIWASIRLPKNKKNKILHKPVTILFLLFIFFIPMKKYVNYSICAFTLHITTNVQTLCWRKTSPSFSGAHSSCISRSINTIFVPQIGIYIRINMSQTDFIYLKIWFDSVIFCQRGHFFTHPVYNKCDIIMINI